jgi:uncharacterized membrane protein YczE
MSRRAARRLPQLVLGVSVFGLGIALMARSRLGLDPWSVLHEGLSEKLGLALGTVDIILSVLVLATWFPLRQAPGIGTIAATFLIGAVTNLALDIIEIPVGLLPRFGFLLAGSALIAVGTGLYLSVDLGPGARDGLMTGLHQRAGWSIRAVRIGIELSVLAIGFVLGGTVGLGTFIYAVAIGPMVHVTLRWWDKAGAVMRRDDDLIR